MSKISIIVPIHKFNDEYKGLLNNAIVNVNSIEYDIELAVTGPKDVLDSIKREVPAPTVPTVYFANEESDFCTLVNNAVSKITSPYFSVLEVDDEYTDIWFKNFDLYSEGKTNVSVFMPLVQQIDIKKGENNFVGFLNEVAWAQGFTDTPGYLTHDGLMAYYDYNVTGAIINTEDFKKAGMLKPSIKIFFWYELLLRMINLENEVYVIPKIGYKHMVNREDSLISEYSRTISQAEAEGWLKIAQEEYLFKTDRKREPVQQ